ncbi:hypothetical protein V2J09_021832 [Rumex salicifolius]
MKRFDSEIIALFETHAAGVRADRICRGLGFENSFRVDAVGQSGGVWLLWKSELGQVSILGSSPQYIHARIDMGGELVNLIVVYAAPSVSRRSSLWGELKRIVQGLTDPVFIGGDFNTIVRLDERSGGNGRLSADSLEFGNWANDLSLIDMGFRGSPYTWKRGRTATTYVAKRLDIVLCCAQARLKWQEAGVTHLPFLSSDHAPLYLQFCSDTKGNPVRRPFRFEAAWLKHSGFKELLIASWDPGVSTPSALDRLRGRLKKWNREVFRSIHRRKADLLDEIAAVRSLIDVECSDELITQEELLMKELDLVLEQEETLWFQKSREKWIALGDRNTSFFHTSTIIRRRKNRVEMLRGDDGRWEKDWGKLEEMAIRYYSCLYSMDDVPVVVRVC